MYVVSICVVVLSRIVQGILQGPNQQMQDSRGEASFIFRCRFCKRQGTATIKMTGKSYTIEDCGKPVRMADIDIRGLDLVGFKADGKFQCKGIGSTTQFEEVDLEDGEWYDYDEKAGQEVSITDVQWDFIKA